MKDNQYINDILDLAKLYKVPPNKVHDLVETIVDAGYYDPFKEAERIISENPDQFRFKHANVPADGIECPMMWVQHDAFGTITICLGNTDRFGTKKKDIVAKYVVYDPRYPQVYGSENECLKVMQSLFKSNKRKERRKNGKETKD